MKEIWNCWSPGTTYAFYPRIHKQLGFANFKFYCYDFTFFLKEMCTDMLGKKKKGKRYDIIVIYIIMEINIHEGKIFNGLNRSLEI